MNELTVHLISNIMLIFMKITIFIIGYLTIRLGYNLLMAGVKGEFKFSAKFGGNKADLASVSPGLLFVLLGALLIGYAHTVKKSSIYSSGVVNSISKEEISEADSPFEDEKRLVIDSDTSISTNQ